MRCFHGMVHVHFGHLDLINFTLLEKTWRKMAKTWLKVQEMAKNNKMAKMLAKEKNPSVNSAHLALVIF